MAGAEFKALGIALGVLNAYDFQEAASPFADYGTAALPATVMARGAAGGPGVLGDQARSLQISGASGLGDVAGVTIPSGHPMSTAQEFSVVQAVYVEQQLTSVKGFVDRANVWTFRHQTNGQTFAAVYQGSTPTTATSNSDAIVGGVSVIGFSWKEPNLELYINGALDGVNEPTFGNDVPVNTTQMRFAWSTQAVQARNGGHQFYNRALTPGEHMALADAAEFKRPASVFFDRIWDDESEQVEGSASLGFDQSTGGELAALQPRVVKADGAVAIPSFNFIRSRNPLQLTVDSTQQDYTNRAMAVGLEVLQRMTFRPNETRLTYFDENYNGTGVGRWRASGAVDAATEPGNRAGPSVLAGVMARFLHAGGSVNGLKTVDPLVKIAKQGMDYLISLKDLPTSHRIASSDFGLNPFGQLLWLLDGLIPQGEWDDYFEHFEQAAEFFNSGGTWTGGTVGGNLNHYINFNREWQCACFYAVLAKYDAATWATRSETQWELTINEAQASPSGTPTGQLPSDLKFGLVKEIEGTDPMWADYKVWGREFHGGNQNKGWWNFGTNSDNDAGYETVDLVTLGFGGKDWAYTFDASRYGTRRWLMFEEDRDLRILNGMRNVVRDRVDTSTWIVNAENGSRHANDFRWDMPFDQILHFKGGRSDLNNRTEFVNQWRWLEAGARSVARAPAEAGIRDVNYNLGNLILADPRFEGPA